MLNFNTVSGVYDFLARLVFGKTLEKAKISQLSTISNGQSLLFIGGGTGATLNYLNDSFKDLKIDYVEMSSTMIEKAKKRNYHNLLIEFYNQPIEAFEGRNYDVIITEFFLDLFDPYQIDKLVAHISDKLGNNGFWIDVDFRNTSKIMHKLVLSAAYLFFRLTVNLRVRKLTNPLNSFKKYGLKVEAEKVYRKGLVTSRLIARNQSL